MDKVEVKEEVKTNKKNIILIIVAVLIFIGILIIGAVLEIKKCERLEKEWAQNRVVIGDVCVDMGYYAKKIKEMMDSKDVSIDEIKEFNNAMNDEIDKKIQYIEELNSKVGEIKTNAQQQWENDHYTLYLMNEQRDLINTRIAGYGLIRRKTAVTEPCDELILIYARSDLRHNEIYSNNEQTVTRFKEANIRVRFSEEIEEQTKQYIKEHYFGY